MKCFNIFFLFFYFFSFSQNDDCLKNFFSSKVINHYKVYNINVGLDSSSLSLNFKEITEIKNFFKEDMNIAILNKIKQNQKYKQFVKNLWLNEYYSGFDMRANWFTTFSDLNEGVIESYKIFNDLLKIDSFVNEFLLKNKILNISIYTYNEIENIEYYIYEKGKLYNGYFEFKFNYLSNSYIESVLKIVNNKIDLNTYNDQFLGYELKSNTETIVIPIVKNGEYICDIKIIICR